MREDNVAALVDGAGFQFGAGAADGDGVDAAATITGRRFANRLTAAEKEKEKEKTAMLELD